jgi:RecB family endonuclease NucS
MDMTIKNLDKTTHKLENGHTIIFDHKQHKYINEKLKDPIVIGMSSVLKYLHAEKLEEWKRSELVGAIKEEMIYQKIPLEKVEDIIINAKTNNKRKGDKVMSVGSTVHKYCEMWLKNQKFTEPENKVVKECFEKFKKFWLSNKLELVESEKILYSVQGFCGTLDIIGKDKEGNLWLIDIKTSTAVYHNYILQIHGYKYAYEEQTGKKIKKMYIIRLPKNDEDFEKRQISFKKEHEQAFLGLLNCHKSVKLFNEQCKNYNNKLKTRRKNATKK